MKSRLNIYFSPYVTWTWLKGLYLSAFRSWNKFRMTTTTDKPTVKKIEIFRYHFFIISKHFLPHVLCFFAINALYHSGKKVWKSLISLFFNFFHYFFRNSDFMRGLGVKKIYFFVILNSFQNLKHWDRDPESSSGWRWRRSSGWRWRRSSGWQGERDELAVKKIDRARP